MKITYILGDSATDEETYLARAQGDALIARGHEVRLVNDGGGADGDVVVREIPQPLIVHDGLYRTRIPPENEPMRVLLAGAWHSEPQGIEEGYGAVAHARWFHQKFDLIRFSQWAPSREEPLDSVQEFHVGLDLLERTRLIHTCDVVIGPSRTDAGFDLVAAEAMAAGVATVLTSVPAHLDFADPHDYAVFAPAENAIELGERLIELLSDYELREWIRGRGRAIAEQWRAANAAAHLEQLFVDRRSVR